jgi:trigger factor
LNVQIEKEQQSPVEYLIKVTVPAEIMAEKVKTAMDEVAAKVALPGFRPGHIPRKVIEQRFGAAVAQETVQDTLQEAYRMALTEAQLEPASPGEMGDIDFKPGDPLTFSVKVEVAPEFELAPLSEISVELLQPTVEEEDILRAIDELRESQAVIAPTDDPVARDSVISMDLQELDATGVAIVGRAQKDLEIDLSKTQLGEEFASKVIGLQNDQTAVVEFPIKGEEGEEKITRYQVTVRNIRRKELPPLNDDLAQQLNPNIASLDDLKNDIKRYLEARATHQAHDRMFRNVVDEILRRTDFPVPPRMLDDYLDHMIEDASRQRKRKPDQSEIDRFKEEYRASAIWSLRWYLARKKVISQRDITVTDEDYNAELERLAQVDGKTVEEFKRRVTEHQTEHIMDDLLERKVLQIVESEVQIIPRAVSLAEFEGRTPSPIMTA